MNCNNVNVVQGKWIRASTRSVMSMLTALHTRRRINVSANPAMKAQDAAARVCRHFYSSLAYKCKKRKWNYDEIITNFFHWPLLCTFMFKIIWPTIWLYSKLSSSKVLVLEDPRGPIYESLSLSSDHKSLSLNLKSLTTSVLFDIFYSQKTTVQYCSADKWH